LRTTDKERVGYVVNNPLIYTDPDGMSLSAGPLLAFVPVGGSRLRDRRSY
jgi:hypothetical protein